MSIELLDDYISGNLCDEKRQSIQKLLEQDAIVTEMFASRVIELRSQGVEFQRGKKSKKA